MSAFDLLQTFPGWVMLANMTCLRRAVLASSLLLSISVSPAAAQETLGPGQYHSLQQAIDRGRALYLYDRAAWVTSDQLVARLPADRRSEVGGWVVTRSAKGLHVDYFGKDAAADQVIFKAEVSGDIVSEQTVYPASAEPPLKEAARTMARALRAARTEMGRHSDWKPCTDARFNAVVLPPDTDGVVPVYFLTPQTQTGSFPFGGHYEVDVSPNGRTASARAFSRSCISMKTADSRGAMPAALFVTHIMDPHPTEIHVFEQYYVGVPVYVGTGPNSVWKVDNGRVDDVSAIMAR